MTGRKAASTAACAGDWLVEGPAPTAESTTRPPVALFIISSRSCATPFIDTVDSGLVTWKLTVSAHVFLSGNIRTSTSLKVLSSRSLSAFAIVSATMAT